MPSIRPDTLASLTRIFREAGFDEVGAELVAETTLRDGMLSDTVALALAESGNPVLLNQLLHLMQVAVSLREDIDRTSARLSAHIDELCELPTLVRSS